MISAAASCLYVLCRGGQKLFQRAFDMHAAGALEQNRVARLRDVTKHSACLAGVLKEKCGIRAQAGFPGRFQHMACRALYPEKHVDSLLRGITAHVAMQSLRPTPEFEHLP